jgi:hypothetical protein
MSTAVFQRFYDSLSYEKSGASAPDFAVVLFCYGIDASGIKPGSVSHLPARSADNLRDKPTQNRRNNDRRQVIRTLIFVIPMMFSQGQ